jgi:dTMP kinase
VPVRPGLLVSFEGGEGAGKSTALAAAEAFLRGRGEPVLVVREPGGTALGERLRALLLDVRQEGIAPEAELLLMFASRAQLLAERVRPALTAGFIVLCDRFTDASFAYQGGGRGLPLAWIAELERRVVGFKPALTILLDLSVQASRQRLAQREPDRIEREEDLFFERVRMGYLERARREPERFRVVDAGQRPEAVGEEVRCALESLLRSLG